MSDQEKPTHVRDGGSPTSHLADAIETEKAIADALEQAIPTPASIEEEMMLEAAELLEVELPEY